MKIDMSGFTAQMHSVMQDGQPIPKVQFKAGSDIDVLISKLTELVIANYPNDTDGKDEVTKEEFIQVVADRLNLIREDEVYGPMFGSVDVIANQLYIHTNKVFTTLKSEIAPAVEMLATDILEYRDKVLMDMGAEVLVEKVNGPKADYVVMDWKAIDTLGGKDLIMTHVRDITKMNIPEPTKAVDGYILSKMDKVNHLIRMESSDYQEMLDLVCKHTKLDSEKGAKYVSLVFDPASYRDTTMALINNWQHARPATMCLQFTEFIHTMYPVLNVIKKMGLPLSNEVKDMLNANIEAIKQLCMAMGYFLVYNREMNFKDALILDDKSVNGDTLDTFTASGGEVKDIAYHLRANYELKGNITLPFSGVKTEAVLADRNNVNKAMEQYNTEIMGKVTFVKHDATTKAFKYIAHNYAKANMASKSADISEAGYLHQAHVAMEAFANELNGSDHSIEDALYGFLIRMYHKDSLLSYTCDLYKKEAVAAMESHNELSDHVGKWIEYKVASKVMTKAMADICLN